RTAHQGLGGGYQLPIPAGSTTGEGKVPSSPEERRPTLREANFAVEVPLTKELGEPYEPVAPPPPGAPSSSVPPSTKPRKPDDGIPLQPGSKFTMRKTINLCIDGSCVFADVSATTQLDTTALYPDDGFKVQTVCKLV